MRHFGLSAAVENSWTDLIQRADVDVVWIGIEGTGVALVNGERHELRPGVLLLIPKGTMRAVEATSERLSYLSVHRRRRRQCRHLEGAE